MKKVVVLGMNIREDGTGRFFVSETAYGNLLNYPDIPIREMLQSEGFGLYSESDLQPEDADIILCVDLDQNLLERLQKIPSLIPKILLTCESPIFTRLTYIVLLNNIHWCLPNFINPMDAIVTWNRSYEAANIIHYDIPVSYGPKKCFQSAGKMSGKNSEARGVAISDPRHGDHLGMVGLREELFQTLARKDMIDRYGKHLIDNPQQHSFKETGERLLILQNYSFAVVIENYWAPGYVSPQLPTCIMAGIPVIYWGDISTAQRRFPDTFVPLEELSVPGFLKAREQLISRYAELRENVLKCREESDHWCDSWLDAIREVFRRVASKE